MFEFPAASVNEPSLIPIMCVPLPDGVKVAVYTVLDVAEKLLIVPPDTAISPTAKSVVASDEVKVSESVASLVESPSLTAVPLLLAAVIAMVGAVA